MRSLAGYSPYGRKESDTTEMTEQAYLNMSCKYYNPSTLALKYKNNSQTFSAVSEIRVYSTRTSLFICTKNFCLLSTLFTHFV